jgi:hypothetical protein
MLGPSSRPFDDTCCRMHGRLIITTPNPCFWGRSWQALYDDPPENSEYTAWFSMGILEKLLRRHQFNVESAQ